MFREAGRLWGQPVGVDGVRVDTGGAGDRPPSPRPSTGPDAGNTDNLEIHPPQVFFFSFSAQKVVFLSCSSELF